MLRQFRRTFIGRDTKKMKINIYIYTRENHFDLDHNTDKSTRFFILKKARQPQQKNNKENNVSNNRILLRTRCVNVYPWRRERGKGQRPISFAAFVRSTTGHYLRCSKVIFVPHRIRIIITHRVSFSSVVIVYSVHLFLVLWDRFFSWSGLRIFHQYARRRLID